ncbi:hypothetical protein H6P81_005584 [Aristolochia fimbriata]|uniref:WD repeat-containing protein 44 n=1 Tax=Aristolochia fimbriata TaxID=158543 RepID=A0AAV7EX23_ARIFI|nr:hypothetical protein H6P81_005584 [Aristolochia fimbriata]
MGFFCGTEEEDHFFDTREDISSVSDSASDCGDAADSSHLRYLDWVSINSRYEVWIRNPESVHERRDKFLKLMGLDMGHAQPRDSFDLSCEISVDVDRMTETSGAVLRNSACNDEFSSSRSSISAWSNEGHVLSDDGVSEDKIQCRIRNLDDGTEFIVDELGSDGNLSRLREVRSNRLYTVDEFQRTLGLSPLVQQCMRREESQSNNLDGPVKKRPKKSWLRRLGAVACVLDRKGEEGNLASNDLELSERSRSCKVRVRSYKKRTKELSALYRGQEIEAHQGPILTMKFSPDGKYLASAGEDGVVRVWLVTECERNAQDQIPVLDPSCVYFMVNQSSELTPLIVDKEKVAKKMSIRKSSDSACVIFPPTVFQLSEKPVHEFYGHSGDVLDLSWSKTKYLLSSSTDNTVRLWQVGHDRCLKVFSHSNYVTCVQFNPVDENYFISGSIDGKVRIWTISGCQVVDWTDISEIVTAVCYRPDGQAGIVGSITGKCRFYDASGNHLQLDAEICLQGKKKSPCKRITGFQFCPGDSRKVMVTSADSQVRILDGFDVISKYRGLRNTGSQISASFTSDGKHIVSASEDSNVYVWNCCSPDGPTPTQPKSIWSCEHFMSSNASVAIPWSGFKSENSDSLTSESLETHSQVFRDLAMQSENDCNRSDTSHWSPTERFSLNHGFFLDALPKGSATWPEEKLPSSSSVTVSSATYKSHFKFLKTSCQNSITSHAWGLVIVTAGWDGRIRSFLNYGLPIRF